MAGIIVFLTITRQQLFDFVYCRNMMSEGEELATLLGVVALASALNRAIFVAIHSFLLIIIFLPALDLHIVETHGGKGLDKCLCQADIRHQRNVVIDGTTTDLVAIGQLA